MRRSIWDPTCVDTLAAAYAEAGQFDEAVKWQTKAVRDPRLPKDSLPRYLGRLSSRP